MARIIVYLTKENVDQYYIDLVDAVIANPSRYVNGELQKGAEQAPVNNPMLNREGFLYSLMLDDDTYDFGIDKAIYKDEDVDRLIIVADTPEFDRASLAKFLLSEDLDGADSDYSNAIEVEVHAVIEQLLFESPDSELLSIDHNERFFIAHISGNLDWMKQISYEARRNIIRSV